MRHIPFGFCRSELVQNDFFRRLRAVSSVVLQARLDAVFSARFIDSTTLRVPTTSQHHVLCKPGVRDKDQLHNDTGVAQIRASIERRLSI